MKTETGPPFMESRERPMKETEYSRPVGGRLNKHQELTWKACLGRCKASRSPYLPTRIFNSLHKGLGWVQSCSDGSDGFSNTLLSQDYISEKVPSCGNGGQRVHSKYREVGKVPPITEVHLTGQPVVVRSSW